MCHVYFLYTNDILTVQLHVNLIYLDLDDLLPVLPCICVHWPFIGLRTTKVPWSCRTTQFGPKAPWRTFLSRAFKASGAQIASRGWL